MFWCLATILLLSPEDLSGVTGLPLPTRSCPVVETTHVALASTLRSHHMRCSFDIRAEDTDSQVTAELTVHKTS